MPEGKTDAAILRVVVGGLCTICGICLIGIIVLAAMGKEPPVALASICSICAGALVGILVPSGKPVYIEVGKDSDQDQAIRRIES